MQLTSMWHCVTCKFFQNQMILDIIVACWQRYSVKVSLIYQPRYFITSNGIPCSRNSRSPQYIFCDPWNYPPLVTLRSYWSGPRKLSWLVNVILWHVCRWKVDCPLVGCWSKGGYWGQCWDLWLPPVVTKTHLHLLVSTWPLGDEIPWLPSCSSLSCRICLIAWCVM